MTVVSVYSCKTQHFLQGTRTQLLPSLRENFAKLQHAALGQNGKLSPR